MSSLFLQRPLALLAMLTLLICFQANVSAQELSQYISDTLDANPRVLEKVHVYRQALRDREAASSGWRPKVDLEGTVSHIESDTLTNNSQSDDYNSNRIELAVSQNLFNGFDTENAIKQADARIQAALYDLYDTMDNVALEAVQAYLDVLKQLRLYELAKKNVASHEETLEQISVRNRSGAGRRSELEQTEGRVARAFASMLAQYNNLEDALTRLHELLGRNISNDAFVEPVMPVALSESLALLTDRALQAHPALKVSQANIQAAQHNHRRAKSAFYPRVDLRLAQEVNDNIQDSRDNDDELSLSLTFRYNLYNGGADRAERDKRVSVIEEEHQFEARVRRQIINTLRLAHKADELLQKQLVYLNQHVTKSQETMVSYREEFFVGERDLIDLLDAKNEVNSAQNSYSEAYYDALAARFRVYEGLGELFPALGLDVQVTEDDLIISQIAAKGRDTEADLSQRDLDLDSVRDARDQCDNSIKKQSVDSFGCEPASKAAVYQTNQAPLAADDEWSITRNGVLKITPEMLLANDSDAENSPLTLVNFSQPQAGKVAMSESGALVFRAADGFVGLDSFTYSIADERGAISSAKVNIHIPEKISLSETQYVNFEFDSAEMTPESKLVFDQILRALKESPNLTLNVFTYTDSKGSDNFNMRLSEKRAAAIIQAFENEGVAAERFYVKAMGEQNPIADNNTEEGRAINRRGEFILR